MPDDTPSQHHRQRILIIERSGNKPQVGQAALLNAAPTIHLLGDYMLF
jgi:hypothetical protein